MKSLFFICFRWLRLHLEAIIWLLALLLLASISAETLASEEHFSLCVWHQLGFQNCWGCGLGRSISSLLKGNIQQSLAFHPLGIFATAMLIYRIIYLFIFYKKTLFQNSI